MEIKKLKKTNLFFILHLIVFFTFSFDKKYKKSNNEESLKYIFPEKAIWHSQDVKNDA
jgi:hypothetical protein